MSRHLSDLYRTGKIVKLNDSSGGEPVEIWLEKLRAFQAGKALRAANAERAKKFVVLRDKGSEEYLAISADVWTKTKDQLVEEVASKDLADKYQAIEAELESEPEWSEHDYIQGLKDAWAEGLSAQYALDSEDAEAKKVFGEFERFSVEALKRFEVAKEDILASYEMFSEDELREKWVESKIESEANEQWFIEYKYQEILYSVRQPEDHVKMYFPNRAALDDLDRSILLTLIAEYNALNVDVSEGKDLQSTLPSSPSSDSVESPETGEESGLPTATP